MKEKTLDKDTIVAYHSFIQQQIRSDLNGLDIGTAWLPCRGALIAAIGSFCCLVTGILVVAIRTRHVYLSDWNSKFLGPFFIIMFLILAGVATYLLVIAKRRANHYRRELFFRPIGDFGVAVVHKSNLQFEQETKPELKSGTAPHRGVMPHSEYYSEKRRREGRDNRGYDQRGDRPPRDEREKRPRDPRDDRERRPRDPRDDRERRPRDPEEQERRARERKEREARGEIDPREREYRERKDRERRERREREAREGRPEGDREGRPRDDRPRQDRPPRGDRPPRDDRPPRGDRPPRDDRPPREERTPEMDGGGRQEGRRAGRGAPKLPTDATGFVHTTRVVLDEDFGRPASRASESSL